MLVVGLPQSTGLQVPMLGPSDTQTPEAVHSMPPLPDSSYPGKHSYVMRDPKVSEMSLLNGAMLDISGG